MAYQINYAYTCHTGRVRSNNEDNFWCCGKSLEMNHLGTDGILTGEVSVLELPLFAVFDGMGGECCGETASWLAAEACRFCAAEYGEEFKKQPQKFMLHLCREMNHKVCEYRQKNMIDSMGTTAALLTFGKNSVYACNLGDSRIYRWNQEEMEQISTDHVFLRGASRKGALVQFVGIPETYMLLDPCPVQREIEDGEKYLLCSDGLTDMLSDSEIQEVLSRKISVKEQVEELLRYSLERGGRDNVTMILCEVKKQKQQSSFWGWLKYIREERNRR